MNISNCFVSCDVVRHMIEYVSNSDVLNLSRVSKAWRRAYTHFPATESNIQHWLCMEGYSWVRRKFHPRFHMKLVSKQFSPSDRIFISRLIREEISRKQAELRKQSGPPTMEQLARERAGQIIDQSVKEMDAECLKEVNLHYHDASWIFLDSVLRYPNVIKNAIDIALIYTSVQRLFDVLRVYSKIGTLTSDEVYHCLNICMSITSKFERGKMMVAILSLRKESKVTADDVATFQRNLNDCLIKAQNDPNNKQLLQELQTIEILKVL